jgi:predicted Fe-S protein YdhL (DUF1289 family)
VTWPEADQRAALEWQAYQASVCEGCRRPVSESFAPEMDDKYHVEVVVCHACAARERKAQVMAETQNTDAPLLAGLRYIVTPEED